MSKIIQGMDLSNLSEGQVAAIGTLAFWASQGFKQLAQKHQAKASKVVALADRRKAPYSDANDSLEAAKKCIDMAMECVELQMRLIEE